MRKIEVMASLFLIISASVDLSGCATAAVGAAGAVGGIAYTDRGAKGEMKGTAAEVNQAAKEVFQEMKIHVTDTEMKKSGQERTLEGKKGTSDVSVEMTQGSNNTTQVEVVVKEDTLRWNKDRAKEILAKIVNR